MKYLRKFSLIFLLKSHNFPKMRIAVFSTSNSLWPGMAKLYYKETPAIKSEKIDNPLVKEIFFTSGLLTFYLKNPIIK
jgi:hypothetical protein